jgi:hypothetical protein
MLPAGFPAPECLTEPRYGDIDYSVNEAPVKGLQPGFDYPGQKLTK